MKKIFSIFIFICASLVSCTSEKGEIPEPLKTSASPCDTVIITYSGSIKTIVQNNCINPGCHGSAFPSGDLRQYAGLKAKVDNNSLNSRVLVVKDIGYSHQSVPPILTQSVPPILIQTQPLTS